MEPKLISVLVEEATLPNINEIDIQIGNEIKSRIKDYIDVFEISRSKEVVKSLEVRLKKRNMQIQYKCLQLLEFLMNESTLSFRSQVGTKAFLSFLVRTMLSKEASNQV